MSYPVTLYGQTILYIYATFSAMIVPIGFLIGAGFVTCEEKYMGIILMTVAVMFMSLRVSGYCANIQDVASR